MADKNKISRNTNIKLYLNVMPAPCAMKFMFVVVSYANVHFKKNKHQFFPEFARQLTIRNVPFASRRIKFFPKHRQKKIIPIILRVHISLLIIL